MVLKHKIFMLLAAMIFISSCSIDEVEPLNLLNEDNVVRDEKSAQLMLNRVYSYWAGPSKASKEPIADAFLSGELITVGPAHDLEGFQTNQVLTDNHFVKEYYSELYAIVNQANWLISQLEEGNAAGISETSQNEILAQAKTNRAWAHFNLLRLYGQFYDLSSELGVVIRTAPAKGLEELPRSSVNEVYLSIVEDLSFAVAHGTTGVEHFYMSKTTAQALLAKVYLYMNDYSNAATTALAVINNTDGYQLEGSYSAVFSNRFHSSEVLFAPFTDAVKEGSTQMASTVSRTRYSSTLQTLADNQVAGAGDVSTGSGFDPRFSYAYSDATKGVNFHGKYPYSDYVEGNTNYYFRLAEVYLIFAEAKARLASGVSADADAITRLNEIRGRAGVDPLNPATRAELLEAVRQEKMLELFAENGESWFDLVRYDRLGDLNAGSVKPTITNVDKLILPIPKEALAGNTKLVPNPGY